MQEAGCGARLVVKERGSERLGKLGLAHSRGAEEEEGGERPARVGQPGARAHDRVGHRLHRHRLPLDARSEALLQPEQLLRLLMENQRADRILATVRFEPAGCHTQCRPPLLAAQADPLLEHWNSLAHSLCW